MGKALKLLFLLFGLSHSVWVQAGIIGIVSFTENPSELDEQPINGGTFNMEIIVNNPESSGTADGVSITYDYPSETTVENVDIESPNDANGQLRSCTDNNDELICDLGAIDDTSGSNDVIVLVTLRTNDPTISVSKVISHSVFGVSDDGNADPGAPSSPETDTTRVVAGADLEIDDTIDDIYVNAASPTGTAGVPVSFTVAPKNLGPNTSNNGFDVEFDFTSVDVSNFSSSGTDWSCGSFNDFTNEVTCTFSGSLTSGDTTPDLTLTVTPQGNGKLELDAAIGSTTLLDPDESNNARGKAEITIDPGADLAVTSLTRNPTGDIAVGSTFTYNITVENNGPDATVAGTDAAVIDFTVPSAYQIQTGSSIPSGWICPLPFTGPGTLTCTNSSSFANGTTANFTFNTQASTLAGTYNFAATIRSETTTDYNTNNNAQDIDVTATANTNLQINGHNAVRDGTNTGIGHVFDGENFEYRIQSRNRGPATATGTITMEINLPDEVTYDGFRSGDRNTPGFEWTSCVETPAGSGDITCSSNGVAVPNDSRMDDLYLDVTANLGTETERLQITNEAEVFPGATIDPNFNNNDRNQSIFLYPIPPNGSGTGQTADISISKADFADQIGTDLIEPFDAITNRTYFYEIIVNNDSPTNVEPANAFNLTAGTITVVDIIPPELIYVSDNSSATDWDCNHVVGLNQLTCTLDLSLESLNAGGRTAILVEVRPDPVVLDSEPITVTNNVSVAYTGYDYTDDDNNALENTDITGKIVDLVVNKFVSPSTLAPTQLLTYRIDVSNLPCLDCTGSNANNVTLVDRLNDVMYYEGIDNRTNQTGNSPGPIFAVDVISGTDDSCNVTELTTPKSIDDLNTSGGTPTADLLVSCDLGTIPFNQTKTVHIQLRPYQTEERTNAAYAYTRNDQRNYYEADPSPFVASDLDALGLPDVERNNIDVYNKSETSSTVTGNAADVQIVKNINPNSGQAGVTNFNFALSVRNNGPSTASNLEITDTLPTWDTDGVPNNEGMEFTGNNSFGDCEYTPSAGAYPNIGGTVTCKPADLSPNTALVINIPVRPTNFVGSNQSADNTGEVAFTVSSIDEITFNNSSTSTGTISQATADLLINKTDRKDSLDPVAIGQEYFYTIVVTNRGPSRATDVTITDDLPTAHAAYKRIEFKTIPDPSISIDTPSNHCSEPAEDSLGGQLVCNIGLLEDGESAEIEVFLIGVSEGVANNNSQVDSARTSETLPGNNAENETTSIRRPVDFAIQKSVSPSPVSALQPMVYTLDIFNNGSGDATVSYLRDTLPLGVTFLSLTIDDGRSCPADSNLPTAGALIDSNNRVLNCRLGAMASGERRIVTINLRAPNALGPIKNTATINDVDNLKNEGDADEILYDAELSSTLGDNEDEVDVEVIGYGIYGSVYQDIQPNGNKDVQEDWSGSKPTVYVKLTRRVGNTCQGPALDVETVPAGNGSFGFPLPPPTNPSAPGNIVDNYCLILDDNATLSDITPASPANWVITEPSNNVGQRFVVLGLGPTTSQDFGLYQQDTTAASIKGTVFEDNGLSATAHDGNQGTQEFGIAGLYVSARQTDCNGTILDQTYTDNNGNFEFFVPAGSPGSPVAICVAELNGYISVSENVGNSGSTTPGDFDSTIIFTPTSGTNYTGLKFGKVGRPAFVASQNKTSVPGATEFYPHTFTAYTEGSVTFSVAEVVTNNQIGWSSVIYRDSNCDGEVQPSEPVLTATTPITVSPDSNLVVCIVNKVLVPTTTAYGSQHRAAITANFAYQDTPLRDGLEVVDLTTVSDGSSAGTDVTLVKSVQKRNPSNATCSGGSLVAAASAFPGECLVYTLEYINQGTAAISDLKIFDATPPFTTFVSAACGTTPTGLSCTVPVQPTVGAMGAVEWHFTGSLRGGAQGDVTYEVKIDE